MKTVIEMAREADKPDETCWLAYEIDFLERFADLVRADERNSWPAEMKAMERQVNILTDALAQAKAAEREACATECERMMMYPNARQESAAHDNVWAAAKAIRARGNT